ncbi:hypothetical protein [Nitrobacter sp. 62-13]|jgi:hypothetical protein|uniref:hypothetical protein n=1 Tax=Nitrobacter sp. 62-13 TaxID=1895797 RepID=UPI000B02540B|nr:hypothetical protein [Nitrobacter sp. 62-13]
MWIAFAIESIPSHAPNPQFVSRVLTGNIHIFRFNPPATASFRVAAYWKEQFMHEIADEVIDLLLVRYATTPIGSLVARHLSVGWRRILARYEQRYALSEQRCLL